ncbi:MAG: type II secretion system protein N [Desulfobulbus sp.]|nr:type II secretion system protein N [Desulfobulbus sp.]
MLSIVIRLIVITALVYAGVQLWYGRVEQRLQDHAPPPKTAQQGLSTEAETQAAPDAVPDDEVQAILARNIFQATMGGETATETETAQPDIDQLAQTQLSLSLLGTVTGDQNDARAIIRDDKTKLEDLYQVGSEIQGAIINLITRGKVVLLVNGREEALVITDRDGEGGPGPRNVQQRMPIAVGDPDEDMIQPTPRAVPRRRISFRSPAPRRPIVAPQEILEPPVEDVQGDAAQELPAEPETDTNPTDQETEPAAEMPTDTPGQ